MPRRIFWKSRSLKIDDEPLALSLLKYRQKRDRHPVSNPEEANLVSSLTDTGKHMPIIDLDVSHSLVQSSSEGHSHLVINVEMSKFRLFVLMWALYFSGIIELGHFVWTVRRGATFVRVPWVRKSKEEEFKPSYGWFFKLRQK